MDEIGWITEYPGLEGMHKDHPVQLLMQNSVLHEIFKFCSTFYSPTYQWVCFYWAGPATANFQHVGFKTGSS